MKLRKFINNNPAVSAGALVVVIAVAGCSIWGQMRDNSPQRTKSAFYTIDDGKTWFVDDISKIPPFEKDGKTAYGITLVQCWTESNPDPAPQPLYLYRYTATAKPVLEKFLAERAASPGAKPKAPVDPQVFGASGKEYKRPGDKDWIGGAVAGPLLNRRPCKQGERSKRVEAQ